MSHYLFKAAGEGDIEKVKQRLAKGDDIDYRHKGTQRTSLAEATLHEHTEIIEYLLDHGADINATCTTSSYSSLGLAAWKNNVDILRLLISRGADVNHWSEHEQFGRNPAMIAASGDNLEALMLLVEAGADLSFCDRRGFNAMNEVISSGSARCQKYLEEIGAPPAANIPEPQPLDWPELSWDPSTMEPDFVLPDGATPAEVLYSYILTMYYWELGACAASADHLHDLHQSDGQPNPEIFDRAFTSLRSAQQRGEALAKIHLTAKTRHITRANGISSAPHFTPDYCLYKISQPKPTRTLLHVQREYPHNKGWIEEWVFVCVKKARPMASRFRPKPPGWWAQIQPGISRLAALASARLWGVEKQNLVGGDQTPGLPLVLMR